MKFQMAEEREQELANNLSPRNDVNLFNSMFIIILNINIIFDHALSGAALW